RYEHALTIGITRRCVGIANEDAGENILTENQILRTKPALLKRAYEIINLMHANDGWTLLALANAALTDAGYSTQFLTPLGLTVADIQPEEKGSEHWDIYDDDESPRYKGLYIGLQFGGADCYVSSAPW